MAEEHSRKIQPRISLGSKTLILFALAVALILNSALAAAWWRMGKLTDVLLRREAYGYVLLARSLLGWPITDWQAANKRLATIWADQVPQIQSLELISLEQSKQDPSLKALGEQLSKASTEEGFFSMPASQGLREYFLAIRTPAQASIETSATEPGSLQGFIRIRVKEYGSWGNLLTVIWIAVMVGLFAMLVFQLIAQRMFLHPLRQLRRTAEKIAKGNIQVRSHIRTGDEYEELSDAFNSMLARLADASEQLQAINRSLDVKLEEVSRANVALSETNKLKSEFIANVSHELRTPLNSIIGFAELLTEIAKNHQDERAAKYADNILRSGRSLLDIINDLLDLAKIEAGKAVLHIDKTSLAGICEDLFHLTGPLADKKQLQVELQINPNIPLLQTDGGKLQQILYNLLSNAIKFTPAAGRIRIEGEMASEDLVAVTVLDNGPGISKEDQKHIFDKFTQVDPSTTRQHGGAGLGLAIAKDLARMLGGELTVTSELGQGAAFTLTIPKVLNPPQPAKATI